MNKIYKKYFVAFAMILGLGMTLQAQCPDIYYGDASTRQSLVNRGWDTLVTCDNPAVTLICTPYITCSEFDHYEVESIPYNPPDTTFCSHAGGGGQLPVNQDDYYDNNVMSFPFSFSFFGRTYNSAVVGPNGNVSFNTSMTGQFMPYSVQNYAPIPSSTTQTEGAVKNNIFGLWEDIDPRYFSNTGVPNAGIHKAIYTIPAAHNGPQCRMLCVSYNGVPKFGHSSAAEAPTHYSTSQIVCYEGTNIIEVHIKRHSATCGTDGNKCVVGIINPTGDTAYTAPGRNPLNNQDITVPEAWRFTPKGRTIRNIRWFYGDSTDDEDEIMATITNHSPVDSVYKCNVEVDEYGVSQYMGLWVSPTVPTTYTVQLRYTSATGVPYVVNYPFHVGVDFSHNMSVTTDTVVCKNVADTISIDLSSNDLTYPTHNRWLCDNPNLRYTFNLDSTRVVIPASQPYLFFGPRVNDRDKVTRFSLNTTFNNGCKDSALVIIRHINRIDDTTYGSICDGEAYTFCGQDYTMVGTYSYDTATVEGCPYTKYLRLETHSRNSGIDYQKDCHPLTWMDSNTYYESNNTATVTIPNQWGCDSVITLNFTFDNSLEAIIEANPLHATLDNLSLMLKDVSKGSDRRRWYLPDGRVDTNVTVYYNFPTEQDSISFMLEAFSPYGCIDTAYITIPLLKEAVWFPNAFTPGREENNHFQAIGIGIETMEMEIYDRRGILINKITDPEGFWDGTDFNGNDMPQGNYVWRARYTTVINPGNPISNKGNVLLIR